MVIGTAAHREWTSWCIRHVPEAELYAITGIQKQLFNTIYQLMAVKQQHPEYLKQAKTFLMLPDYFHFLLTGKKVQEYTNATSTQLVNVRTKEWDRELLERLGYPEKLFEALAMPGTEVGRSDERDRTGSRLFLPGRASGNA